LKTSDFYEFAYGFLTIEARIRS